MREALQVQGKVRYEASSSGSRLDKQTNWDPELNFPHVR